MIQQQQQPEAPLAVFYCLFLRFLLLGFARAFATRHAQVSFAQGDISRRGTATDTKNIAAVTVTFTRDPLTIPTVESKCHNKK